MMLPLDSRNTSKEGQATVPPSSAPWSRGIVSPTPTGFPVRLATLIATFALSFGVVPASGLAAQSAAQSGAQSAERSADSTAALETATALLRAISTRDAALARQVMLPGAQLVAIGDPAIATARARTQTDSAFVQMLTDPGPKFLERMWEPTLFLQGSVATIHAAYDFHLDGAFSHCGVDTFTLVKSQGQWRISHIAYTTQRSGCAPSPLGTPKP